MARYFGDPDRARRHKELAFQEDMRVLVEDMTKNQSHIMKAGRFVPSFKAGKDKEGNPRSAIVDVMVAGSAVWQSKFQDFLKATTYDPALGYPIRAETSEGPRNEALDTGTVFDNNAINPIEYNNFTDVHGAEEDLEDDSSSGALGGGGEYSTGC